MFRRLILGAIRFYRRGISPWTPPSCRFTPTCSEYAHEAISMHGLGRGGWLAVRRLLRCRPFGSSGYDPVPPGTRGSSDGRKNADDRGAGGARDARDARDAGDPPAPLANGATA